MTAIGFEVVIGALTFTGSLMAAAKLQELLRGAPITYPGQNASNFLLLAVLIACLITLLFVPAASPLFFLMVALSLPSLMLCPTTFGFAPKRRCQKPLLMITAEGVPGLSSSS